MPKRINSFASLLPVAFSVFAFVATITVCSPARADSVCIEQSNQQAPQGTHWSARYDRPAGRKCWFLLDAYGRDATALLAQPGAASSLDPMQTLSSQLASLFGNSTGAAPVAAPQITPPNAPRKPQGNPANAYKTDNRVRADQRSVGDGHAAKRASPALTPVERDALFGEFVQWRQSQQSISVLKPWPASQ
jgi:hypothetical protein